ncbi:SIR2 family protein [Patulibacter minatonensis]|uniref:SIR2 family protein n=1 Tax=Patulibacter minatonensis TaxID=298163 RepID=UPI00047D80D9|nr:SIR2 family protein [Patulibacter minatonensis]
MTQKLLASFNEAGYLDQAGQALNFVCGAIAAYDAAAGHDPLRSLDVERVYSAVELLAERRDLEVSPFVASWHPAVDVWDRPRLPSFWDKRFAQALAKPGFDTARDEVVALIRSATGQGTGDVYRGLADRMVQQLKQLVAIPPGQTAYLGPLLEMARDKRVDVTTLNYDLAVEQEGAARGIDVSTGIESWTSHRSWDGPEKGVRLLKLHGSIDWRAATSEAQLGHIAREAIAVARIDDHGAPQVVFGKRGKLKGGGPFRSMLSEFEQRLAGALTLISIGYAYRDDHVNHIIEQWLAADHRRGIVVIDPSWSSGGGRGSGPDYRDGLKARLNPDWLPEGQERPPNRMTYLEMGAGDGLQHLLGSDTGPAEQSPPIP